MKRDSFNAGELAEINSGDPLAAMDAIENLESEEDEPIQREKPPCLSDTRHRFLVGLGGFFILIG